MLDFNQVEFVISAYSAKQLPEDGRPEIAFAGRSNVGKSSLINTLCRRRKLVKVSSRPGKTQSLNFFAVGDELYLVDLPGYGYAKVPRKVKGLWMQLINSYLETRQPLRCVVVIIDIRHPLKRLDAELISWLRDVDVPCLPVYTKIDKITGNQRRKNAAALDAALGIKPAARVLFSSRTGEGRDELISCLAKFLS